MSGNMPSAHSATMVALTLAVGVGEGYQSAVFALSLVVTSIVIYDALQVRRAVGEQGKAIAKLLDKAKLSLRPYQALGHTPLEVAIGALVGAVAALATLSF